jgi:hypothetical protein
MGLACFEENAHDRGDEMLVENALVKAALPTTAVQRNKRAAQLLEAREAVVAALNCPLLRRLAVHKVLDRAELFAKKRAQALAHVLLAALGPVPAARLQLLHVVEQLRVRDHFAWRRGAFICT